MAQPFSWENTLRVHDEAVYRWLGGLVVDYGTVSGVARNQVSVLRVMATPDRAWADLVNQLVSQNWIAGATDEDKRANVKLDHDVLPLPFLSIERADPQPYLDGGGVPKRFRRQNFDGDQMQWEEHPWPGSYRTEYRVTLWSRKKYTMEWMREWLFSQLGQIGTGEAEVWIPVMHAAPWGTLQQALHCDGSSDLSQLEGDKPRDLRSEFTFTLNTLHFRLPTSTADPINTEVVAAAFTNDVFPTIDDLDDLTGVDLAPATASGNLYLPYYPPPLVPTKWPKAGAATVSNSTVTPDDRADSGALLLGVNASADQVDLVNRPLTLDLAGFAVLSYAFQYLSDAPVDLDLQQHDGSNMDTPVWTRVEKRTLPASAAWARVHGFTLVSQPIFDFALIGTGTVATLRIAKIRVKHIKSGTKAAPTGTSVVSGNNRLVWTGLLAQPYLIVVVFAFGAATGTVVANNDVTAPTYAVNDPVNTAFQHSSVVLIQPKDTSIELLVPLALTIAAVYLQRYDGGYGGNDV